VLSTFVFGLLLYVLKPVPERPIQLDVPLTISKESYWVYPSAEASPRGSAYIMHEDTTIRFVDENSAGSALCKHDNVINHLDCGWLQNNILHRGIVDLNPLLPPQDFNYTWVGNGYEFHASRMTPLTLYLTISFYMTIGLLIIRL